MNKFYDDDFNDEEDEEDEIDNKARRKKRFQLKNMHRKARDTVRSERQTKKTYRPKIAWEDYDEDYDLDYLN